MGFKKFAFPPKVEIWLHRLCLPILLVQKNTELILFAKNLGKICSRRICEIVRKFRVISPKCSFQLKETRNLKFNLGPFAGVDYNLTLCQPESTPTLYPMGNPMQESTFFPSQGLRIWPLSYHHMYIVLCFGQWYIIPLPPFSVTPLPPSHPRFFGGFVGSVCGFRRGWGEGGIWGVGLHNFLSCFRAFFLPEFSALPARTIPRSGSFRGHERVRKDPDRAEMCIASTSADPDCPSYMNVREHTIFNIIS
jgi:hypothetical protein